jgi:Tfp pilus assembly protein PilX
MQVSTMEEIMAGNMKDCNEGFQAAEAAIQDAADWLSSKHTRPEPKINASNNIYSSDAYTLGSENSPAAHSFAWNTKAIKYGSLSADTSASVIGSCTPDKKPTTDHDMGKLSSLPCLVIEEHDFIADDLDPDNSAKGVGRYFYRITTRGFGSTKKAHPSLEAIVYKRYN